MISDARINFLRQYYIHDTVILFSDVLAIIDQESSGTEFFFETDHLFKDNLAAASKITGVPELRIKQLILAPAPRATSILKKLLGLVMAPPNRYLKFRCEPSIYALVKDFKTFTQEDKFLLSCSFGIGQRLVYYWLTNNKIPQSQWISSIKFFSTDLRSQMKEIITNLRWWVYKAKGNKLLGYSYYNAGGGIKQPTAYGASVAKLEAQYAKYNK